MSTKIENGRKVNATPGTDERLCPVGTYNYAAGAVGIQALPTNTQAVAVGGAGIRAAIGSRNGVTLAPGQAETIDIDDPSKLFLDVLVATEGVSFVVLS